MKNQKGFTLIELLLVLAIIGIISAIAVPALLSQRTQARNQSTESQASNVASALQVALSMCEKPQNERTASDMQALAAAPTASQVVTAVLARPEFAQMKNPFTNGAAYTTAAAAAVGNVGIVAGASNGTTLLTITYAIKDNAGAPIVKTLARTPETTLAP